MLSGRVEAFQPQQQGQSSPSFNANFADIRRQPNSCVRGPISEMQSTNHSFFPTGDIQRQQPGIFGHFRHPLDSSSLRRMSTRGNGAEDRIGLRRCLPIPMHLNVIPELRSNVHVVHWGLVNSTTSPLTGRC